MKNNNIHKILGVLTTEENRGRESFRYDELPGLLDGMPEHEIMGYLDQLEEDQPKEDGKRLIVQKLDSPHFTRFYTPCIKAYKSGKYKQDEPAISKVELLPQKKTFLGMTYTVAGIIGGIAGGGMFVFTSMTLWRDNRLEKAEGQHQKDKQQIEQLYQRIDSIRNILKNQKAPQDSGANR